MTEAYIYDACRTPRGRGKPDGALHSSTPIYLAAHILKCLKKRNGFDKDTIEEIIMGVVEPIGEQGADIARVAALMADYGDSVPGIQVSRFCASGLEAVNLAAAKIMANEVEIAVAGGVESMSRIPLFSGGGAWLQDPAVVYPTYFVPQGVSADLIATRKGYSRTDIDTIAVTSHQRAAKAWENGYFNKAIEPVSDINGEILLEKDQILRPQTSLETLAKLPRSFEYMGQNMGYDAVAIQRYPDTEYINHFHGPGNSSGIVDGAAAILLGTKEMGQKLGLKPRARIKSMASVGSEPTIMLTGPMAASHKALKKAGMNPNDVDLYEVNEAFAVVVRMFMDDMNLNYDKVNVNGGAIAMGHPVGATGTMLLGTVLDELERRNLETGLVTLCVGAGMGTATIIERV